MLPFFGVTAIFIHLHAPHLLFEAPSPSLGRQQKADENTIRLHHMGILVFQELPERFYPSDGNWPSY